MKEYLNEKLNNGKIRTRTLLARARLMQNSDWDKPVMNDSTYLPFYYHLGTQVKCKKAIEIGFGLGLSASAFVQGCETLERFAGFHLASKDYYYSLRLGSATLQEYFKGNIKLDVGDNECLKKLFLLDSWDIVLITQKFEPNFLKQYLNLAWKNTADDALIIVDHLVDETFQNWCKSVNREPEIYNTRHTLGIVKR